MFHPPILRAASELIVHCKKLSIRIATAESCTGGLIAGALTSISGSSAVFERGFNTYSNQSKCDLLKLSSSEIDTFGAVSEQVAGQMAEGALNNAPVQLTVAVTGVAGPEGGSLEKPVGTVHIASARLGQKTLNKRFLFKGDRHQVRIDTVSAAIDMMLQQAHK